MASMVETEAAMARWEMKEETLQNTSPNTQSLYGGQFLVLQKVASELHPKVRNHGEGPY